MANDNWLTLNGVKFNMGDFKFNISDAEHSLYRNFPRDVAEGLMDSYRSTDDLEKKNSIENICEDSMAGVLSGKARHTVIAAYRAGENSQRKDYKRKRIFIEDGLRNKKKYIVN